MMGMGKFLKLKGVILIGLGLFSVGIICIVKLGLVPILHRKIFMEEPVKISSAESRGKTDKYAMDAYNKMSIAFVRNAGQTDSRVRYYRQGQDYAIYFLPDEVVFAFVRKAKWSDRFGTCAKDLVWKTPLEAQYLAAAEDPGDTPLTGFAMSLRFIGVNPNGRLEGRGELKGKINYFMDNDPVKWQTGLFTYQEVVYHDLWPGVDLVFRGDNGPLKYEFILQPGAILEDIRFTFDGSDDIYLNQAGDLLIKTLIGTLTDKRPLSYQQIGGEQAPVKSGFVLKQDADGKNVCAFELGGDYDPRYPLVIDPEIVYSTFLGGDGKDIGVDIAVDGSGNAYVTGTMESFLEFPITVGAFDVSFNGGFQDVFVTKLDVNGINLVYSTLLGGSGFDRGMSIDVDALGNAYVTGITESFDFPTLNAFDPSCGDGSGSFGACQDVFVTKLDSAGANILYSTYLGGTDRNDFGRDIAVDLSGNAYVTGDTQSLDFPIFSPVFVGPPDNPLFDGGSPNVSGEGGSFQDAFVVKFDINGSPIFSTFLGGSDAERALGIAVDALGNAYVTGDTVSDDFPAADGAFDTSKNDDFDTDAFVAKLGFNDRAELIYATYLGGSDRDLGKDIAIDDERNAYVMGLTSSADFPATPEAFDPVGNGDDDVFIAKLDPNGTSLVYSTYLGGIGVDEGNSIAVDSSGNAYVTGRTFSNDFPVTDDALDLTFNDVFVGKLDAGGTNLIFGTFLGGTIDIEVGNGIALDTMGNVYVTGETDSRDFPVTDAALDTTCGTDGRCNLTSDVFVMKLMLVPTPALIPTPTVTLTPTPIPTITPTPTAAPKPGKSFTFNCSRHLLAGPVGLEKLVLELGENENCVLRLSNFEPGAFVEVSTNLKTGFRSSIKVDPIRGVADDNGELEFSIRAIGEGVDWVAWTVPNENGEFEFSKRAFNNGFAWGMFVEVK